MRKVLSSNSEVAHVWASMTQSEGESGNGNFSFVGRTLYSYSTPIAEIIKDRAGNDVVIATSCRYSITTSTKHQSEIYSACSHLLTFWVPVHLGNGRNPEAIRAAYAARLDSMTWDVATGRTRQSRTKRFQAWQAAVNSANRFCEAFGLEPFPVPQTDADTERTLSEIREREAKAAAERAERERKEAAKAKRLGKVALRAWLAGESRVENRYAITYATDSDHLRISPNDPDEVETTRGAVVPREHIERFAPVVLRLIGSGREWSATADSKPIRFGHYTVDRIDADGTLYVGCHTFKRAEIERFAAVLGIGATVTT